AMTLKGLCLFLDISDETWRSYRAREDFIGVITRAENVIYDQKFSGAAADLLNANIIARDLGLKEQSQVEDVTPDKGDRDKRRSRIQELLRGNNNS
ncbi:terminase small subunit, partial [Yersinia sp. 2544 StPb PI]